MCYLLVTELQVEGRRKRYYSDGTDAVLMTRQPQPLVV
jgi:hypothetical protein